MADRPIERSAAYSLQVAVKERFMTLVNYEIVEKPLKGQKKPYVLMEEPEYVKPLDTKTSRGQELRVRIRVYDDVPNSDAVKDTTDLFMQSLSDEMLTLETGFSIFYYRVESILPELVDNNEVWRTTISFIFDIYQAS